MSEIKNLKKAADRIKEAIKKKEKIILFGDTDMDGVTSVIILKEAIKNLGGDVAKIYFPDLQKDGYGLNKKAVEDLKDFSPALIIMVDCGIGNFKEIDMANDLGFEVVIIDHHEILDKLPNASVIVDPKQKGDKYPFKFFAAVGLTFKVAEKLLEDKMTEGLRRGFLELVALATIADMMPKTDDNEEMIIEGLSTIESSWRPGIQAMFELDVLRPYNLSQKVNKVNAFLNVRNLEDGKPLAFRLLTSKDKEKAQELASTLYEKNQEKKIKIRSIVSQIKKKIDPEEPIIFIGDKDWELILLGIAASIISKDYQRPTFLYTIGEKESQGSVRAPGGYDTVKAMKESEDILETYGGHPMASGFRIKNSNLEEFKKRLIKYYK